MGRRTFAMRWMWVAAGSLWIVAGCSKPPPDPVEPPQAVAIAQEPTAQRPSVGVQPSQASPAKSDVPRLPTAEAQPLSLSRRSVMVAQPSRAQTSGNNTHGTVGGLTFLAPDGQLIASGGNDDRVHVHDIRTGKEVFVSGKLGKDVDHVVSCKDGTFAAETYSGKVTVFTRSGDKIRKRNSYKGSMGALLGWTDDCKYILHSQFLANLEVVEPKSGRVIVQLPARGHRSFSIRDNRLVHAVGEQWMLWTYRGTPQANSEPVTLPSELRGAPLVQAHVVSDGLLVEYCQPGECTVQLLDWAFHPAAEETFDATHSVWVMTLGSFLRLSPDRRYLFFYRDGVAPQVVELQTGRRVVMDLISRTMSSTVKAAFSAYEPGLLAVTMTPAPNKISLFDIGT